MEDQNIVPNRPLWKRPTSFVTLLSLLLGVGLLWAPRPFWWLGVGLLSASVGWWRQVSRRAPVSPHLASSRSLWRPWFGDVLSLALVAGVVSAMMPEILSGQRPINHDHTVHFVKAWRLSHDFLAHGQLWGWSHQWFGGYPAQYLYPIGADLLVVLVRCLSFGLLTMGQAYALAFWLHWVLLGYAVYALGRRSFSGGVGLLAALLFVTDIGAYRMGGWIFTAQWGVWPMSLSLGLMLLAVARLRGVLYEENWRDVAWFGLWTGLALLTHPIQLVHLALLVPLALLVRWLTTGGRDGLVASFRLLLGAWLGLAIGGLWLFPFLATRAYSASYGAPWWDTFRMGLGIYKLDLLPGTWALVIATGFLGLLAMLFSRRFFPLLFATLTFVLLLTSSSTFVQAFHLAEFSRLFQNLQFQRFAVLLKPYLFLAAAAVLLATLRHVASLFRGANEATLEAPSPSEPSTWRAGVLFVRWFLIGTLLAPLLYPAIGQYVQRHLRHVTRGTQKQSLQTSKQDPHAQARDALVRWARKEFPKVKGFFRVALSVGHHKHRFFDLGTKLQVPLYKIGFTPSTSYRFKMESSSTEMLKALNVRYVVTLWPLAARDFAEIKRFGKVRVYRFRHWSPQPFRILTGQGTVTLKRFAPEDIVLQVGPKASGTLRLNVSYFPRWSATRNGQPIPIQLSRVDNNTRTGFMTVKLQPGTYHFRFRRSLPEWLSGIVFLLGLGITALLAWADRRRGWGLLLAQLLSSWLQHLRTTQRQHARLWRSLLLGIALAVMGVALGMALWQPHKLYPHPSLQDKKHRLLYDFLGHLPHAEATKGTGPQVTSCRFALDRFHCGPADWQHIHPKQVRLDAKAWLRCLWMHPQPGGPVSLQFKNVEVGNTIAGYFGVAKSGYLQHAPPVTFKVYANNKLLYTGTTRRDGQRYHYRITLPQALWDQSVDVRFSVSAPNTGRRHFCFLAQGLHVKSPQ